MEHATEIALRSISTHFHEIYGGKKFDLGIKVIKSKLVSLKVHKLFNEEFKNTIYTEYYF